MDSVMDDLKIIGSLKAEMRDTIGYDADELIERRTENLKRYEGELIGDERFGRSQVITRDVLETVEGVMPFFMRVFYSTDDVVKFEPVADDDIELADQMTLFSNHVLKKQNEGFNIIHTWVKDALISDMGAVKYYYDTQVDTEVVYYEGLTDEELTALELDFVDDVVEHTSRDNEEAVPEPIMDEAGEIVDYTQPKLHDIKCRKTKPRNKIKIENVPPEEIMVSRKARSMNLDDCPYLGHRVRKTVSDLIAMGFDSEKVLNIPYGADEYDTDERLERFDDTNVANDKKDTVDPYSRTVYVIEHYIRLDTDGDEYAELLKIVTAGGYDAMEILDIQEVNEIPFALFSPIMLPHRVYGLGVATLATEIEKLHTALLRQMMDSLYLSTSPRMLAVDNQVNIDDLLTAEVGGIVRAKSLDAVRELPVSDVSKQAMPMMQMLEQMRAQRTGVSQMAMTLDPTIAQNETATAARINQDAAGARLELMAQTYAETGLKRLVKGICKLGSLHYDEEMMIRLKGSAVQMNPRKFNNDLDLSVNVGLAGNKERQIQMTSMLIQDMANIFQLGGADNMIVNPKNVYAAALAKADAMGIKGAEKFFTDPEPAMQQAAQMAQSQPPQKTPEEQLADAQTEAARIEGITALQRIKLDAEKAQKDLELRERALELKEKELEVKAAGMDEDQDIKREGYIKDIKIAGMK